jgi:putative ABC transport system permease protein
MIKHCITLFIRNSRKFSGSFSINLIGLGTALTCAILIYIWVVDELAVDKFHEHDRSLYQLMIHEQAQRGVVTSGNTHHAWSEALKAEFPEIDAVCVTTPAAFFPAFTLSGEGKHVKANGNFSDKNFFTMFSFPLLLGNPNSVLADKNSIAISENVARKIFGTIDGVVGKTLEYELFQTKRPVVVSGIFKDISQNSSVQFDFVLPFQVFADMMNFGEQSVQWNGAEPFETFVLFNSQADIDVVQSRLTLFIKSKDPSSSIRIFARPFSDRYLFNTYNEGIQSGGRIDYVIMFAVIGVFILLIACVNFINLATARATRRIKEVGIKKTVGAQRSTLIWQYMAESMIMSLLAFFIAIALAQLLLPQFSLVTSKSLSLTLDRWFVMSTLSVVLITGVLGGIYPALYLSAFRPASILKGPVTTMGAGILIRKGLVVFQFVITVIFITAIIVVQKQVDFLGEKSLGYQKEHLIYLEAEGNVATDVEAFLHEVRNVPGVERASSMLGNFVAESGGRPGAVSAGQKTVVLHSVAVNHELLETLGVTIIDGTSFRNVPNDTAQCIVNESAVHALNLANPVGTKMPGTDVTIVGVVKDFHFQSLYEKIEPFMFRLEPHFATTIMVRLTPVNEQQTLARLEELYRKVNPGFEFNFHFLDQQYQHQYVAERRVSTLIRYAAGLSIIISCLGLLGLVGFSAERRMKEISIRKILGSTASEIWIMLSRDFMKLVIVAVLIALPLSYLLVVEWLDHFAFRIALQPMYFVLAGGIVITLAILTVTVQTLRAAKANPTRWIKTE